MKRIWITVGLIAGLVCLPMERPKAQMAPAICLVIIAAAAVGGVVLVVKACAPKYYCVRDESQVTYCLVTTPRDAALAGLRVLSGPYKDGHFCEVWCSTNTVITTKSTVLSTLTIERSYDLVNWTVWQSTNVDLNVFTETQAYFDYSTNRACYYRANLN
jgi:hypothetical protein